jgi:glutathione S-transferase
VFESAVICEYLDETLAPRLHPEAPLERAHERGWMEFGSAVLNAIGAFYSATDDAALEARAGDLRSRFARVEDALGAGPYFAGTRFGLVDVVFGPVFRYFDVFDAIDDFRCLKGLPKTQAWRAALAARPSVQAAAHPQYAALLREFVIERRSALSRRMAAQQIAVGG